MADEIAVDIEKRFGGGPAIRARFRLSLEPGATAVLFGPSGAGKTTVLRSIAGLETPDRGVIAFGEEVWFDAARPLCLSPPRRRAGLVFQDYALFPHLTVRQNIEYGIDRLPRTERRGIADDLIQRFDLAEVAGRRASRISGGQAQRVAVARAVAPRPRLLLLDEPLAALDLATRVKVRRELKRMLASIGIPSVLVTHDRAEAIALGEQAIVMVDGEVRQAGPLEEVFRRPADATVANTLGVETLAAGVILEAAGGLAQVRVGGHAVSALLREELQPGDRVLVCIRAEEVTLQRGEPGLESARNHLPGVVESIESDGALERIVLDCGFPLTAVVTRQGREQLGLVPGARVTAAVKAPAVHLVKL
jgi:molybdate transport system ATP-binding protein